MNRVSEFDIPRRPRFHGGPTEVGVHVLSQHVFCPRAAILAMELGQDNGEDGSVLGPRLDGVFDYDELRFAEEIHRTWSNVRYWGMLLVPAVALVLLLWRLWSPMAALIGTLPIFVCLARLWDTATALIDLIREQAVFLAAPPLTIDPATIQIQKVNWWSLRKAGFDCLKPADAYRDPGSRLVGKPWRLLVKGTVLRIPVIRKHYGDQTWRPQHRVRISAYCRLIETCQGGQAPFGILLFAGSDECLIIPNTVVEQTQFEEALQNVRGFLQIYQQGQSAPMQPVDRRCIGCPFGEPREYIARETDTLVNGTPIVPLLTRALDGKLYHSPCGDRFNWVPPHQRALDLRIFERR
jgi:hypothetical protein